MRKIFAVFIIGLSLVLGWSHAFSETSDTMDAEALLKLAPRISLEEENISTFEVKGMVNANGFQLQFIVSGKKPDQLAVRIMDLRDTTPIMVGVGNCLMFYDPISSEVLLDHAITKFNLAVEKVTEDSGKNGPDGNNLVMNFWWDSIKDEKKDEKGKEEGSSTTVIDIPSLLTLPIQPLEVTTTDGKRFVLQGKTKNGSRLVAYVIPSRKEGPYTRLELYNHDFSDTQPSLVLDHIVINQHLSDGHFSFPEKKLLASALSTKQMWAKGPINSVLSLGKLIRTIAVRLVLAGVDDPELRTAVEKMSTRKLDWEKLREEDKKASTILKSIFKKR